MNRAECKAACRLHLVILSIKAGIRQAVRQVVFNDVLIVGQLDVDGQSFALIGLHKTDPASDWLLIKRHCIGTKGLLGVQLQN